MAKLTGQGSYSVVCDHLGTPLELYDAKGTKTWQAQLDGYGAVREGKGRPQDCPFRYPDLYEDVETGLYKGLSHSSLSGIKGRVKSNRHGRSTRRRCDARASV